MAHLFTTLEIWTRQLARCAILQLRRGSNWVGGSGWLEGRLEDGRRSRSPRRSLVILLTPLLLIPNTGAFRCRWGYTACNLKRQPPGQILPVRFSLHDSPLRNLPFGITPSDSPHQNLLNLTPSAWRQFFGCLVSSFSRTSSRRFLNLCTSKMPTCCLYYYSPSPSPSP